MSVKSADEFEVLGWTAGPGPGSVAFFYRSPRFGDFTETLRLPQTIAPPGGVIDDHAALLDLMAVVLGVSYFKAHPVERLALRRGHITDAGVRLVQALYTEGLGEFYVRNGLAYPPAFSFSQTDTRERSRAAAQVAGRQAVVGFGGGKDSYVAAALLDRAGVAYDLASVVLSEAPMRKLAELANRPLTFISRRIDPRLLEANRSGALNGHIPITAINALILALYAASTGADWVVLANERSADEPTMISNGHPINHQFSKSFAAETLMREALASVAGPSPTIFSALRSVTELWIARALCRSPEALSHFASCNRNFVFGGDHGLKAGERWCRRCAKCVFTAIITAPFLTRAQSIVVFGGDVLDDEANVAAALETVGLSDSKPWDCVGSVGETSAALWKAAGRDDWSSAAVVRAIAPLLAKEPGAARLEAVFDEALSSRSPSFIPAELAHLYGPG